jgi:hypothetical protein
MCNNCKFNLMVQKQESIGHMLLWRVEYRGEQQAPVATGSGFVQRRQTPALYVTKVRGDCNKHCAFETRPGNKYPTPHYQYIGHKGYHIWGLFPMSAAPGGWGLSGRRCRGRENCPCCALSWSACGRSPGAARCLDAWGSAARRCSRWRGPAVPRSEAARR